MKPAKTPQTKLERAQSLLEFAISLIVLLFLLTGAVEFGLALFQYVTVRDAAQEGSVYGSIRPLDEDGIRWRTIDAASDVVELDMANIDIDIVGSACEGNVSGTPNAIVVTATFAHPITFPFVADMIGNGTINLVGSSTATILQPPCP